MNQTAARKEPVEEAMRERQSAVKQAFMHAWQGYVRFAFGHDEVHPVTNRTNDSWGSACCCCCFAGVLIVIRHGGDYRRCD